MPFHIDHICSVTYLMYIIRYIYIYLMSRAPSARAKPHLVSKTNLAKTKK